MYYVFTHTVYKKVTKPCIRAYVGALSLMNIGFSAYAGGNTGRIPRIRIHVRTSLANKGEWADAARYLSESTGIHLYRRPQDLMRTNAK